MRLAGNGTGALTNPEPINCGAGRDKVKADRTDTVKH